MPVGHDCLGVCPQGLDEAKDVVPAATVEACAVLPQLKQDLIHLKGSWQCLNQHSCLQTQHVKDCCTASINQCQAPNRANVLSRIGTAVTTYLATCQNNAATCKYNTVLLFIAGAISNNNLEMQ